MTNSLLRSRSYWTCGAVTAASAAVSAGFSVAAVLGGGPGDGTALYAASRSLSLVAVALALLVRRSAGGLIAVAATMCLVQAADAAIGLVRHDAGKTVGPLVLAAVNVAVAALLYRRGRTTG